MTTQQIEQATKTLNDLLDQREQLNGRSTKLASDRQSIAYSAHVGDKGAKDKLRKINDDAALVKSELETIESAILEARDRVELAEQNAARAADQANALALREKLAKFIELGNILDDCFADFKSAALEMKQVVDDIHRLGCAIPDNQLFRVNCDLAFKTAVQGTPFWSQDFPALGHFQKKTFRSLVESWAANIEANIASRLPKKEAA